LRLGTIPVINENDTVATSEIRVGDNDRLAARVAAMIGADTLVLLSDIDGLYTADPSREPQARFVPVVESITPEIEAMAGEAPVGYSSGGMVTKLAAARIAVDAGCRMAIADGTRLNPLKSIAAGARATWFLADIEPRAARKLWISGSLSPAGTYVLDQGAAAALQRQEPAAGRRDRGNRRVSARRRGAIGVARGRGGRPRPQRLFGRRGAADHRPQQR
jgi:glutamate 5-kinase